MTKDLDAYKGVFWLWNGKECSLGDLTNSQLKVVREVVRGSVKLEFFNSPRGLILNAVNEIIKYRHNNPYETIVNTARERFSKRKYKSAEIVSDKILELFIKPHLKNYKYEEILA